jgi:hypothetical protein
VRTTRREAPGVSRHAPTCGDRRGSSGLRVGIADAVRRGCRGACPFGGKLKTAGRRHREPCNLGDYRAEPAMPQSLLKACKYRGLVAGVHVDDAIGQEPDLRNGGREEIVPREFRHASNAAGYGEAVQSKAVYASGSAEPRSGKKIL